MLCKTQQKTREHRYLGFQKLGGSATFYTHGRLGINGVVDCGHRGRVVKAP